jgi:type IV pilus assembly protein PilE
MTETHIGISGSAIAASHGQNRGFSLIELMVAVAIVAILATIAYPAYLSQMKKSRRASAEAFLMDIAQREQQYLLDRRSYADKPTLIPNIVTIPNEVSAVYSIAICQTTTTSPCATLGGTPPVFVAIATPTGAQAGDYTLALDNTGKKYTIDSTGTILTSGTVW